MTPSFQIRDLINLPSIRRERKGTRRRRQRFSVEGLENRELLAINFVEVGSFQGVDGGPDVLSNSTSLQFGPDGRLYVSEQNGSINAFTVSIEDGEYIATAHEELLLPGGGGVVKSIQNHNDDGSPAGRSNRQVTGILVTGTADNPVLYISSSDPEIASNGEKNSIRTPV